MEAPTKKMQYAQFYTGATKDEAASVTEGRPIFKDVPFVRIFVPGDKDNIIDQPAWIDEAHENSHSSRFPDEWKRFKDGLGAAESGTPLELLPGVSKAQVEEMKYFHVRTVEQLAGMSDSNSQKFMGVRKLQAEAKAYLERAAGAAPEKRLQAELEKRDNELATLRTQVSELVAQAKRDNEKRAR
jgi:hypothetical protein